MARLIYSTISSVDGYVEDREGRIDWAAPDQEVFQFINDLERPAGTYLYGRRMYETMVYWETAHFLADQSPIEQDFARLWQAAGKVVYSRTLDAVSSARTRIERAFDPETVRLLKASTDRDVTVGGPELAAQAFKAGLVDECHLFLTPVILGAASDHSLTTSGCASNCSTSAASAAAWRTSTTASAGEVAGRIRHQGLTTVGKRSPCRSPDLPPTFSGVASFGQNLCLPA